MPGRIVGFLIVFLGAGIGGAMRHGVSLLTLRLFGAGFPLGTLIVNFTGSLLMGMAAAYFAHRTGIHQHWRLFLATGILGGYTTFSTFSLDAALLYERGSYVGFASYVIGSVVLALGGFFAGLGLFRYEGAL